MNNQIKLNKNQQELIELKKQIIVMTDRNDEEEVAETKEMLKRSKEDAFNSLMNARHYFEWAVNDLHEATAPENLYNYNFNKETLEAIKRMKKAEKELKQAQEFRKQINFLYRSAFEN